MSPAVREHARQAHLMYRFVYIVAFAVWMLTSTTATAGNDYGVLFGSRAMLTGGAMSAVVSDGTGLRYNPAGLYPRGNASIQSASRANAFDVSGNAFGLRLHQANGYFRSTDGQQAAAEATEIISIPSATTFARNLSENFSLALGLFAPRVTDLTIRSRLNTSSGDAWVATLSETYTELAGAIGAAYHQERWSIGLAAELGFRSEFANASAAGGQQATGEHVLISSTASSKLLTLGARLGAQFEPIDDWHFGMAISSPSMSLFRSERADSVASATVQGSSGFQIQPVNAESSEVRLVAPAVLRIGAAYQRPRFAIAADIVVDSEAPGRAYSINAMLGGYARVSESLTLGGGVFTDRNADSAANNLTHAAIDYYGVVLSGSFESRYARRTELDVPEQSIVFGTTVGIRYAYGSGNIEGALVPATFNAQPVALTQAAASSHEIMLVLSSSLGL